MKRHDIDSIRSIAEQLWSNESVDIEIKCPPEGEGIDIKVSSMYRAPGLSFAILKRLSAFFETDNITDDKFSSSGCDSCDYGSNYGFTLSIRP